MNPSAEQLAAIAWQDARKRAAENSRRAASHRAALARRRARKNGGHK